MDWSVTKSYRAFRSNQLKFNKAFFHKILFTFLLLLRPEVGYIGSVTFFAVAVFASNNIVVFGFFNHYYFVDTSLPSSGNGTDVKSDIIVTSTASLTGITNVIDGMVSMMVVIMVSVMVSTMMSSCISGVEWESSTKVLSGTLAKGA